ncbi:phytoene desaturase [Chryseotalea sanaruensis]|uniref:Phytoene desaturase n=1 Tax=Chryseotalea sanaruensis TaxID=2482724 RepID=A0A401U5N0_9BACT|nr:phytoene desaturase family protein [Chryseotalea sanaruensis]GCC50197.1 phytoene desaturase [Chryseotalea sanaruensis]
MKKIAVIGSGFAGLSAASTLAKAGYDVTVFEKNEGAGGRARKFEVDGYMFDMGPSWYWMPDVFESYFNFFGKKASDFYTLKRLDPSYRIYYSKEEVLDVPAGLEALYKMFDKLEPGSSVHLKKFIAEGKFKYEVGINKLVRKPGLSLTELFDIDLFKGLFKLHVFESISTYVKKYFKHPQLVQLLEFPVLFLGATPENTPALYSLMNYADLALGTWYPEGGMHKIVEGMVSVAKEQGVKFEFNSGVQAIDTEGNKVKGVTVNGTFAPFDYVVAGADYHHVEQTLLPPAYRRYTEAYWDKRVMAPSSLIFYLGVNKKLNKLLHHNLFFDQDFSKHAVEIYDDPSWPSNPLFYVCCTSKSDDTVAPAGHENVFILVPVAPDLEDNEAIREKYFYMVLDRLEKLTGEGLRDNIVYKRSYAHRDFISDYNAFKGNAYGLANTLKQTANLKPSILNKKLNNLFYTGQLTVPGPGVPPSLISGQVVAEELMKRDR